VIQKRQSVDYDQRQLAWRLFRFRKKRSQRGSNPRNWLGKSHLCRRGCARKRTETHRRDRVPVNMVSTDGPERVACKSGNAACWNYLYLSQKISEVIGSEAREILFQAIANGSVVAWQHIKSGRIRFLGRKATGFRRDQAPKISRLKAV